MGERAAAENCLWSSESRVEWRGWRAKCAQGVGQSGSRVGLFFIHFFRGNGGVRGEGGGVMSPVQKQTGCWAFCLSILHQCPGDKSCSLLGLLLFR